MGAVMYSGNFAAESPNGIGYVVPGCVEDGAWMLWENCSAAVAVAVLARFFLDKFSKKTLFVGHFP